MPISDPLINKALEWYCNQAGKQALFRIEHISGQYTVTEWNVQGLIEPTDLSQLILDYKADLVTESTARRIRKRALMTKIGIARADLKGLNELIKDGNDD